MNHRSPDEQDRVREHPEDFSVRTRREVEEQLAEREEHGAAQAQEQPPSSLGVRAASQRLSSLVRRARAGETILITVEGKEMAQLCPVVPRIDAKGEA